MIKYIGSHLLLPPIALADILGFFWNSSAEMGEKKTRSRVSCRESYLLLRVCRGFCLLLQIILSESALT